MKIAIKREQNPNLFEILSSVRKSGGQVRAEDKLAWTMPNGSHLHEVNLREAKKIYCELISGACMVWKSKFLRKMRIVTFLLLISITQAFAREGYAQTKQLSLNLRNETILNILNRIEDQSEFYFMFDATIVDVNQRRSINCENQPITAILDQLLKDTKIVYEISDRQIVLTSVQKADNEQSKTVSGLVTDSSGSSLPGVTIVIKKTTHGVITDANGYYKLSNVPEDAILVFSFVGLKTQEVPIAGKTTVNVVLTEETIGIEEVVAVGYGTMRKVDMTGSAASVQAQDLVKAPVKSFDDALSGRMAGVQVVSRDGQPGALPQIVIRGANSITQDNSPLYVIDGFPIEGNDNNSINTNDIESIDVLKDASATAIYGARAANGVIMITTKRGKAGTPVISYDAYYGFQEVTNSIEMLNPYEFVKLQLEINEAVATDVYFTTPGLVLDDYKTMEGIDWFQRCLQTAPLQSHNLSVRGGTGASKYSVSGNYFGQDGIFINTGFERAQGRITLDQEVNRKLKFGVTVNYSDTKTYGAIPATGGNGTGFMNSLWSYRPVFPGDSDIDNEYLDPAITLTYDQRTQPVLYLKNEHRESFSNNLTANGYVDYAISKDLKLRISGGMNRAIGQSDIFNNSFTRSGNPATSSYIGINGSESISKYTDISNDNTLTWSKKINKNHSFNVVGGFTQQQRKSENFGATAVMLTNEELGMSGLDEGSPNRVEANRSIWSLQSFIGRINYNYKSKYLFTASFRADGSSKLSPKNRWGYFPSAALAYRLSSEEFMKKMEFISDAKFRVSYGATGNNRVSDFAYTSSLARGLYTFGNAILPGAYASTLGNADLKWETTRQFNTGIDLSLFKNRITFTGDYYVKKTTDLLLNAQVPYISGYNSTYKNIGSVSNRGLELTLNTVNVKKRNFSWNTSFNISFNRNKILSLTDGQESLMSPMFSGLSAPLHIAKIGHPIAQFYGVLYDGLYTYDDFNTLSDGKLILKDNIPSSATVRQNILPGEGKYKDLNGDLIVNSLDYTIIGDPNPDFIGGLSTDLKYKGFDLSVLFQFSYGNDIANVNKIKWEGMSSFLPHINQFASYANRWTTDNPDGIYPRVGGGGSGELQGSNSRIIEDGSFLRLKTVSLGYTIPPQILKFTGIKSTRIYCTGQNLHVWTKYTGLDPEVSTRPSALTPGMDYSPYPRALSMIFGVNVTL